MGDRKLNVKLDFDTFFLWFALIVLLFWPAKCGHLVGSVAREFERGWIEAHTQKAADP